jgi:hypothetical protein
MTEKIIISILLAAAVLVASVVVAKRDTRIKELEKALSDAKLRGAKIQVVFRKDDGTILVFPGYIAEPGADMLLELRVPSYDSIRLSTLTEGQKANLWKRLNEDTP